MYSSKKFLGCSIVRFNSSLGWGSQPSTLNVTLVEDTSEGDSWTGTDSVGLPYVFEFYDFTFCGIVQDWTYKKGSDGFVYEVVMTDGREILDGVPMIIGGYSATVPADLDNIYNPYGYMEDTYGFGGAGILRNEGMEWWKIRDAMLDLLTTGKIAFRGQLYDVSFSGLPSDLPNYYKIGGEQISLLSYIEDVCSASSDDYFITLDSDNVFSIHSISRENIPELGKIQDFVDSQDSVVRNEAGRELRNETTSKFLVGGNVKDMYFQYPSASGTAYNERTIWPYWGNVSGAVIIGRNEVDGAEVVGDNSLDFRHTFNLDSRSVNVVGVGAGYETDMAELACAIQSKESWEALIWYRNNQDFPQSGRANDINLGSDIRPELKGFLDSLSDGDFKHLRPLDFTSWVGSMFRYSAEALGDVHEENSSRLHSYVSDYANEYYGKKWMVRIPDIQAKYDPDINELTTSLEPTDGGFLDENAWPFYLSSGLIPDYTDFVAGTDGKFTAYARFNGVDYDLSDLSQQDYIVSSGGDLFVRGTLDEYVYFLSPTGLESPRVIFNMPGMVKSLDLDKRRRYIRGLASWRAIYDRAIALGYSEDDATSIADTKLRLSGAEEIYFGYEGLPVIPDMIAVPLQSNVDFYGPWYSVGISGKVEFEKDDTLVPWNYGGFTNMNLAANARVSEALSNMQISEGGTIEVPGSPTKNLGDQLESGGPYVTDISVSFGGGGVTTSYRMQTWTPRFGKISKAFQNKVQQIGLAQQRDRKVFRQLQQAPSPIVTSIRKNLLKYPSIKEAAKRYRPGSPSQVIMGDFGLPGSGETGLWNTVVFAPNYNVAGHMGSGYAEKALASLDTLFRPFNESINASGVPHFESASGVAGVTVDNLNPFPSSDFQVLARGEYLDDDTHIVNATGDARAFGLRFPMIGVGWGYDTDGKPVPNLDPDDPGDNFMSGYKDRVDLWKAGPVDIRWDNDKKLWVAGTTSLIIGKLAGNLLYKGSATVNIYDNDGVLDSGNTQTVYDWATIPSGQIGYEGYNVIAAQIGSKYYVIELEPPC